MKIKPYMEDFIKENYKTMTQVDMARHIGENVTQSDISNWLIKNDLVKRRRRFSKDDIAYMIEHYQDMQYKDIAEHLGFTERQVRGKLNNMGYSKTRKFNKGYFKNIDSESKAYFLGFIYADGYVVDRPDVRSYEFAMQLQSRDRYILDAINEALGGVHNITHINPQDKIIDGVKTRSGHLDCLRVYSKDIVHDLISHGVAPDKTHDYRIPVFQMEYFFDFLRGYIDGDGCFYKRGERVTMNITCSSAYVLEWIQETLSSYNISTSVYQEKKLKYRLCCYNQNDVASLINLLYHDEYALCLHRKFDKIKHLLNGRPD